MALNSLKTNFDLKAGIKESVELLRQSYDPKLADEDTAIPAWVIKQARGVAFLFTYKVGVFASASGGSGIVIAKKPGSDTWGLPIALACGGAGGGLDFGVNKTYQIVVLNSDEAVRTFCRDNIKLGIGINVAAGPVGRQAEASGNVAVTKDQGGEHHHVEAFTYGYSKGIFAGVGVQGMWVTVQDKENAEFYGLKEPAPAVEMLLGDALKGCEVPAEIELLQLELKAAGQER